MIRSAQVTAMFGSAAEGAAGLVVRSGLPLNVRLGLLASVAAGALIVASGEPATAACAINGSTYDCTGDLSAGVSATLPYSTLSISGVTANITPASGTAGISFTANGPVTLDVNTGAYGVHATGTGAAGVVAQSFDGSDVGITYTGNITSDANNGIYATGLGDIGDLSVGNIVVAFDGIHIEDYKAGGGDITVDHTGTLSSSNGNGIYATTQGAVSVTTHGAISSEFDGLHLQSYSTGKLTIHENGDITSTDGYGIYASTQGDIEEHSNGAISSALDGIHLKGYDTGSITLDQTGNITSGGANGVWADTQGSVDVTVDGDVQAKTDGIYARTSGDGTSSTVNHTGNIVSTTSNGIEALAPNGGISVTNDGTIAAAAGAGILTQTFADLGTTISQTGHITAQRGIVASSTTGAIDVTGTGDIDTTGVGISLSSSSGGELSVVQTGYVTSTGGKGIVMHAPGGSITLTGSGDVTASDNAIDLSNTGSGSTLTLTRTGGTITSTNGYGILATASEGLVTLSNTGDVTSQLDAISVTTPGAISVTEIGALDSKGGRGIYASSANGSVNVTATGLITSVNDGITAKSTGPASSVVVNASGGITSSNGKGIAASSAAGSVYVTNNGAIQASGRGIEAMSSGSGTDAKIWQTGDVTSTNAEGVYGTAAEGAVDVNVWGVVQAHGTGIVATNSGGDYEIAVNAYQDVTSSTGYGIYALSPNGKITITADGVVATHGSSVDDAGIYAANTSDALVSVTATDGVSADTGDAIHASSTSGNVTAITDGVVSGGRSGIALSGEGGALYAEVDGGSVSGDTGAAVSFTGPGGTSKLVNNGTIFNVNGIDGLIVAGSQTDTSIENYGVMTGNIALSPWDNSFFNGESGIFNTGSTVDLGNLGNTFTNAGQLSVGGVNNIANTTLSGTFVNTTTGVILDDLDLVGGTSDVLTVAGHADLQGTLQLNLTSFAPGGQAIEFLTANQWISTQEIDATGNPVVSAHISYSNNGKTAYVTVDGFDFAPDGVTGNAQTIGDYFNTVSLTDPGLAPLALGLANLTTTAQVQDALDQLSPTVYSADQSATDADNLGFVNRLFSCKVADGPDMFNAEGKCNWVRLDYGTASQSATEDGTGYSSHSFNLSGGNQLALAPDFRLDIGAGLVNADLQTDNGSTSHGTTAQIGAALKYVPGPVLLAASVTGSLGAFDNRRSLAIGNFTDTLSGTSLIGTVDGRLRAAYTFQANNYYARPQVDLDAVYSNVGAVDETGTVAQMHIAAASDVVLSASPSLEFGGQTILDDDTIFRPYIRGGVTVRSSQNSTTTGNFVTDTSGDSFTVSNSADPLLYNLSAGFDFLATGGVTWRGYYDATLGKTSTAQTGGLKLSVNY